MALALYRTYRPGTLADVVGQEHVTEPLARALASGRTHHAYLLSGPRGCGKTSTARILARSLNCEQGPTPTPCGQCRSCLDLAPNGPGSVDVVEMDAATHRGVDDARDLREKAIYAPAASRYRVYIIDEAHQLTNEAANALLKLIEEPPAHLRFIFATTEPDKIIPTIRSRTFHYPFRLVQARTLAGHLANVCAAEGVPAEPSALALVARAGAGSVRDSLSVLGQLLAGAGPEGLTHAEAVQALGLTDDSLIDGFVAALSAGSVAAMLGVVDGVISGGHDPRRFVSDVLDRLRDLIILRADPGAVESGLIDVPDEAGQRLLDQAESVSLAELSRAADLVSAGLSEVKGATAPRLQLELLCARLALHHPGDDLASVLARLERLERTMASGALPTAAAAEGGSGRRAQALSTPDQSAPTAATPHVTGQSVEPVVDDPASGSAGTRTADGALDARPPTGPPNAPAPGRSRSTGGGPGSTPPSPPRRPTLNSGRGRAGSAPGEGVQLAPAAQPAPRKAKPAEGGAPATAQQPGNGDRVAPAGGVEPAAAAPAASAGADRPATGGGTGTAEGQSQLPRVKAVWPSVLDHVAQGSRVAWALFAEGRPLSLGDGTLAVAVSDPGKVAAITQRGHDLRLREALLSVLDLDVTIDVIYDAGVGDRAPVGAGAPPDATASRPAQSASDRSSARRRTGVGVATGGGSVRPATPSSPTGTPSERSSGPAPVEDAEEPDLPSDDDPDADDVGGLELVARELGARTISEIDHA